MNILLAAAALALAATDPEHPHGHSPHLGNVTFETTCSPAAQAAFEHGLGWLHSFEYRRAEQSFDEAAAADHGCGIADWGVAMSYYHPLWDGPTPAELEKGKSAIEKARAAGAKSERERDYHRGARRFLSGCRPARPQDARLRLFGCDGAASRALPG